MQIKPTGYNSWACSIFNYVISNRSISANFSSMNILSELKSRFRAALAGLTDSPEEYLDQVRPSQDPKFGDYQANLAMPLGKQLEAPAAQRGGGYRPPARRGRYLPSARNRRPGLYQSSPERRVARPATDARLCETSIDWASSPSNARGLT